MCVILKIALTNAGDSLTATLRSTLNGLLNQANNLPRPDPSEVIPESEINDLLNRVQRTQNLIQEQARTVMEQLNGRFYFTNLRKVFSIENTLRKAFPLYIILYVNDPFISVIHFSILFEMNLLPTQLGPNW